MINKTRDYQARHKVTARIYNTIKIQYAKMISEKMKNRIFTKEHREKLSIAGKGERNHNYGIPHTTESKEKISKANKGEKNFMYGKKHTEEAIKKMSEKRKANKKNGLHLRKIKNKEEVLKIYNDPRTIIEIAKDGKYSYDLIKSIKKGIGYTDITNAPNSVKHRK